MADEPEPVWLTREQVEGIHESMLASYGGLAGVRDIGALESALGRPMHRWHYGDDTDIAELAAAYGFAVAKNHPFADGNKRTAFVSMATFYEQNGNQLTAPEADVVVLMVAVASGEISETRLATWLRDNTAPPRPKRVRERKGEKERKREGEKGKPTGRLH
ncbi:MAG: type II toxin-antitoxin system death-on-curing family toxin [Bradyrhizobium sp.]